LLVISDLHLGEGLRLDGDATSDPRTDTALIDFLEHYRARRPGDQPWRLVVNGDAIDFIAVHLMPHEAGVVAGLHPDDHRYGLGSREHAAAVKLEHVLLRHAEVFRALAAFVAYGHELAMVRGNHDVELYWPEVQRRIRDSLAAAWAADPRRSEPGTRSPDAVRAAVSFHDWFVYEPGLAWIEHGHQYDPYCSFDHVLEPLDGWDDIETNIDSAIVRYVANRFVGLMNEHWGRGFWGYLRWVSALGTEKALSVIGGYRAMCSRLLSDRLAHWWAPERLSERRLRHRTRITALAKHARITRDRLEALHELRVRPIRAELARVVRAVMLDRLAVLLLSPWLVVLPLLVVPFVWWPAAVAVTGTLVILSAWAAAADREPSDPRHSMRSVSRRIHALAEVPVVVFGHSHDAVAIEQPGGWYFNTGAWVPHGVEGGAVRAFTHVVIKRAEAGVTAVLCRWAGDHSEQVSASVIRAPSGAGPDRLSAVADLR
jgi:UDP-2,3-diacylglucosamine pyrophosphatase LpxH